MTGPELTIEVPVRFQKEDNMTLLKSLSIILCVSASVFSITMTSGFSVNILGKPDYLWGSKNGMVWRHNIRNNIVTSHVVLDSGLCSSPCISPDGRRVAYFKLDAANICSNSGDGNCVYGGGYIWVMNSDGTNKTRLCRTIVKVDELLDFPDNSFIYNCHDQELRKINLTGTVVSTWRLPFCSWQINIANDMDRAVFRTGDFCGADRGTIVAYELSTYPAVDYRDIGGGSGSSPSCASGISNDGIFALDGWVDHDGWDVRNWASGAKIFSFSNLTACAWRPNTMSFGSDPSHTPWTSCNSTNSNKWRSVQINNHQVLFNWVDSMCIVPTASFAAVVNYNFNFDAGDFWVGELSTDVQSAPARQDKQMPKLSAVACKGSALAITVREVEPFAVTVTDLAGRQLWSARGSGTKEYRINRVHMASGMLIVNLRTNRTVATTSVVVF